VFVRIKHLYRRGPSERWLGTEAQQFSRAPLLANPTGSIAAKKPLERDRGGTVQIGSVSFQH
jgi:hypothetical protein